MSPNRQGHFLGIPYDWRRPSGKRARRQSWNPDEPHIFVAKSYGWGYDINFHALRKRITGRE